MAPGERMPFCAGIGAGRQSYTFNEQAGRPAVLVLAGALGGAALDPLLDTLAARRAELAALHADLLVLQGFASGFGAWRSGQTTACGVPVVLCQDEFFGCCGPTEAPPVVVIDRAARVVASWVVGDDDAADVAAAALEAVGRIERERPAPVLAVPGLFEDALCRELIERFEAGATFDSGVSGIDADGRPHERLDGAKKRRRDWMLPPGEAIHEHVLKLLFRRCAPEIRRAFRHEVSHADRMLVARYDETGGYFRRHRDNVGKNVAFRQFALSVNLNAGAYEGGHLLFPNTTTTATRRRRTRASYSPPRCCTRRRR